MAADPHVTGIAWYRPDQWDRLLSVSEDRDQLESTHAEWKATAEQMLKDIERRGAVVHRIAVDVDELLGWCRVGGRPVNAETRSQFVAEKMRREFGAMK